MSGRVELPFIFCLLVSLLAGGIGCSAKKPKPKTLQQQFVEATKISDARSRGNRLVRLAYEYNKSGDPAGSEKSLEAAAKAAKKVDDKVEQCQLLNFVSYAYGRLKFPQKTRRTLADTRAVADAMERPESRVPVYAMMAEVYEKFLDSKNAAKNLLDEGEQLADSVTAVDLKVRSLMAVSYRHYKLNHTADVQRLESKAESLAQGVQGVRQRTEAYLQFAAGLARQKSNRADAVFKITEETAAKISDALSRGHTFLLIARQMKQSDRGQRAKAMLGKAKAAAQSLKDSSQRDPLLEEIDRAWE